MSSLVCYAVVVALLCVGPSLSAISGTNPATDACLCITSASVNVRSSACGSIVGSTRTGNCFKYIGSKQTCVLSRTSYEFFRIAFGTNGGWVAGNYLNIGSASQCPSSGTGCPRIVSRSEWGARAPRSTSVISRPVPRVFIHHTETSSCSSLSACTSILKSIQNYHMNTRGWADIGYNFLVGEDGNVYEGRGWDRVGAHASNYNSVAIGISVMGSYSSRQPNAAAQTVVKQLIACGVSLGKLSSTYTLHGHRDGGCTDCPGQAFYDVIRTWPNYGGRLTGAC